MAAVMKQCYVRFLYWTESSSPVIQTPGVTNNYEFGISHKCISVVDIPT